MSCLCVISSSLLQKRLPRLSSSEQVSRTKASASAADWMGASRDVVSVFAACSLSHLAACKKKADNASGCLFVSHLTVGFNRVSYLFAPPPPSTRDTKSSTAEKTK